MDLPFSEEVPPSGSDYDDDDDLSDEATAAAVAAAGDDEAESDEGGVDEPATGVRESAVDAGGTAAGGGHSVAGDGGEAGESVADEGKASGRKAGGRGRGSKAPGGDAGKVPGQKRRAGELGGIGDEASPRTGEEFDLPGLTEDAELAGALEAIMLVVDEPVAELQLAQILEQPTERIAAMLDNLSARYTAAGHGFDLRRVAGGWRLYTRPEYAAYVERFVLDGQSVRLTQAALETLAVVAYKQPVTRSRISAIRGVNCDGVMRTLATRGLIEECGTEGETGAHLYRTTGLFLEKLGLNSVDQLPPLAPFLPDDVEEVLDATG
ncbi:SMC-Scp complex subunit ScpB [Paractinoplanes abujensis]|nr:SMC-Scp complex subunit ScpB [Actinoplanes abujensis]